MFPGPPSFLPVDVEVGRHDRCIDELHVGDHPAVPGTLECTETLPVLGQVDRCEQSAPDLLGSLIELQCRVADLGTPAFIDEGAPNRRWLPHPIDAFEHVFVRLTRLQGSVCKEPGHRKPSVPRSSGTRSPLLHGDMLTPWQVQQEPRLPDRPGEPVVEPILAPEIHGEEAGLARFGESLAWQMEGETVVQAAERVGAPSYRGALRLMHVVNLYRGDGDRLGAVQEKTVESMRAAARFAQLQVEGLVVDFVAVHAADDAGIIPDDFESAPSLTRDAREVVDTDEQRALPFVFDLLQHADQAATDAEFVVFTNSDICLTPGFYIAVARMLSLGYETIVINRRTVPGVGADDPNAELAAADIGESHPGHDCFVFRRSRIAEFSPNLACVGAGYVMRGLVYNLVANAEQALFLTEAHLTYHFGNDRPWVAPVMRPYLWHNKGQLLGTYERLIADPVKRSRIDALFEAMPKLAPPGLEEQGDGQPTPTNGASS